MQNIIEGNKLIAESKFVGAIFAPLPGKWVLKETMFPDLMYTARSRDFRYHSSHDWAMSVVEAIEKENYGFKMCRKVVEIYYDDTKEVILKVKESNRITSLFTALVQFITWYNNNQTSING